MTIFSEQQRYPSRVDYQVSEGRLGEEIERQGAGGVERELEVDVRMDLEAAIFIRDWLSERIKNLQDAIAGQESSIDSE